MPQWITLLHKNQIQILLLYRPSCVHFAVPNKQAPGRFPALFGQNCNFSLNKSLLSGTTLGMSTTYIAIVVPWNILVRRRKEMSSRNLSKDVVQVFNNLQPSLTSIYHDRFSVWYILKLSSLYQELLWYSHLLPKGVKMNKMHKRMQRYSTDIKCRATKHSSLSTQPDCLPLFFRKCCIQ